MLQAFLLLLITGIYFQPDSLFAQFSCTGDACEYLPSEYKDNLERIHWEFKSQYAQTLFDDMSEAAAVANLAGPPMGTINLYGFTAGLNLGAGVVLPHDVLITIPGVGSFDKVPSAGGAVVPRAYFGVNVGRFFGNEDDVDEEGDRLAPPFLSLRRLDVFVSGMAYSDTFTNENLQGYLNYKSDFRGVDIRYHVLEESALLGPLLKFRGLSFGAGFYKTKQDVEYYQDNSKFEFNVESGSKMIWNGVNRVQWYSNIDTYPVELKTGIQFLYFLNLSVGVGVAFNKGSTEFHMSRIGPMTLADDELAFSEYDVPDNVEQIAADQGVPDDVLAEELAKVSDAQKDAAIITFRIDGNGKVPAQMPYAKVGVELNLAPVKVSVEGIVTKKAYGLNAGLRFEI